MEINSYILVPLAAWAIAQITKFTIATLKGRLDLRNLYASGGMPSVHAAVVCSLATTAYLVDGPGSHLFGFTAVFAAIVMYDSLGVRRSSGEQSVALNMLIGSLGRGKVKLDLPELRLKEVLGHKPREVAVGAVVGVVLGALFNYERITPLTSFLQQVPLTAELVWYTAVFAGLIIGGLIQGFVLRKRYPKSPIYKKLTGKILTATQVTGWIGLVMVALEFERASYLAWRLWSIIMLIIGLIWAIYIVVWAVNNLPTALASEANIARKLKWLTFGSKRKK